MQSKSVDASHQCRGLYRPQFEHDACGIGALAHLGGEKSHQMIDDALSVLVNLEHRGGVGLEKNTGDGAGILFQIPHRFFRKEAQKYGHLLPGVGDYGVAMLFLPQDEQGINAGMRIFEEGCAQLGLPLLFWRDVPVDPRDLGATARACMPTMKQAFLARPESCPQGIEFERLLYVCRRTIEKRAHASVELADKIFYVCSMSARTIVYKGMLVATQMRGFFPDLDDASTETAIALVHSRYSTNTTPSWERAHPNRYIVHNGEINTLRGNVNWIHAREPELFSPVMGDDLQRVLPVIDNEGSDSAMLDNVLEFLTMNGRSLPRAVTMMLPEPWDKNEALPEKRRAWDAYQSMLMEAWDGPAAIAFSDGHVMGAALDRNGLRPARYYVTNDDRLILSSEIGALDVDPAMVLVSGSLGPGQMLLVDPDKDRVLFDDEIKDAFANEKPYRTWVESGLLTLGDLAEGTPCAKDEPRDGAVGLPLRQALHGFFFDDVEEAIIPMANKGSAPLASMGADVPLLTEEEYTSLAYLDRQGFHATRLAAVYDYGCADNALERALDELCVRAEEAVRAGSNIIAISDRARAGEVPIPSLLAVASVHNHLLKAGIRTSADLIVECGDAITPHDFALLVGYSACGIYPYLAHDTIRSLAAKGELGVDAATGIANYNKAIVSGIVSVMSKMGISTMQGYHSAQIFEAVGLSQELIDRHLCGTVSRVGGLGISDVQRECNERYDEMLAQQKSPAPDQLKSSGITAWRPLGGEQHLINPRVINLLQRSVRENDFDLFMEYSAAVHPQGRTITLRDLLEFDQDKASAIPLDQVEPAAQIVKRFTTGAMSYGSISQEAHECLAIAMNRLGGKSNTGEGGEDPAREILLENGDSKLSAIKQIGVWPLWRDEPLPHERTGDPDQDGAGRQAGRRRAPARQEGLSVDRAHAPFHPGRGAHLAAAAS